MTTRVGMPYWGVPKVHHQVPIVLDHKGRSLIERSVSMPHRRIRGVIHHQVAVCLHLDITGRNAVGIAAPEPNRPIVQDQVTVSLVHQPESSIGGLAIFIGQ
jgi:hypothetical protein